MREGDGAAYRFAVTFRLGPGEVDVDPDTFETTLYRPAAEPGEGGWLFFRDYLWRGEISDPDHLRAWASEALGVDVIDIEFRAFECTETELEELRETIGAELATFRAESVQEAVANYFGSALEVQ